MEIKGNYNNLLNYKIVYSNTRKKTLLFKIQDNTLLIYAPKKVSNDFIMTLIRKRLGWALNKIQKENNSALIQDNIIKFLGNKINLEIYYSNLLSKNGGYCELKDNILHTHISINNKDSLNDVIIDWYKKEAKRILIDRVKYYAENYNLKYNKITIKKKKTVWGTCNSKNDLTFNWKIIMFNLDIVDYIVVHELSHSIHKNHSKSFWNLVESILPNYKELRKKLK